MAAPICRLTRVVSSNKGTFGVMFLHDEPICVTCEDPWVQNMTSISCIPEGIYKCSEFNGKRFKDVWEVRDVPGRSAILIHQGNTIDDTHGCILVGRCFGKLGNLPAVLQSSEAMQILRERLPSEFELIIT